MSSAAVLGLGTLFQLSDGEDPPVYTTIAEVVSINPDGIQREAIDVTSHDSVAPAREFIAGLMDGSSISITLNFLPADATQSDVVDNLQDDDATAIFRTYRIVWSDFGASSYTATVDTDTEEWTTDSNHGWETVQPVRFTTTGSLPTSSPQIQAGLTYFANVTGDDTFTLHATQADAAAGSNEITFTTSGSGDHTVSSVTSWTFSAMVSGFGASAMHDRQLTATPKFKITRSITIGA